MTFNILGRPFHDNALLVRIDTGKAIYRLLFDCGENCLTDISDSEIRGVDHLFFSHFHMDHVSGFERFFRRNYNREAKPVHVWGPPNTADIMHHRFRGYVWNLVQDQPGVWLVTDVNEKHMETWRFETKEAFRRRHAFDSKAFTGTLFENADFGVDTQIMDHGTPCLAFMVHEKPYLNVDPDALAALGLPPGPWLKTVKESAEDSGHTVSVKGHSFPVQELKDRLLRVSKGKKIAYLTDFKMDEKAEKNLSSMLTDCDILICESQYVEEDGEIAERYYHMTAAQAARLAARVKVQKLILFHLSKRYANGEQHRILDEAREIFPETYFPNEWQ